MPDLFLVPVLLTATLVWALGLGAWEVLVFFAGAWWDRRRHDGSEHDGRRFWPCVRRVWLGRWLRQCYGYRRTGGPSDLGRRGKPVVYAVSPHGMVTAATVLTFMVDDDQTSAPDGRDYPAIVTHDYNLRAFTRDIALWLGCVSKGTGTARTVLAQQKRSLVVVPGGKHELDTVGDPGKTHDWLLRRVYENWWVPIVPVWAPDEFGVTWTWRPPWPRAFLQALERWFDWPVLAALFLWPRPTKGMFRVYMGPAIRPGDHATYDAFKIAYLDAVTQLRDVR